MLYDGKHSSELPLLGAVTRETTVAYLEEWISNFSKEPVGNGETTAWSRFTDFSQQSLELGMDSFVFFTLQTGKQMFRGSLSFPMQSWTRGWIAASLCIRSPAPPNRYRHWNKCTSTSPAILPVPCAEWQNSSLLGLHQFTFKLHRILQWCLWAHLAKGWCLRDWEKQTPRCLWHAL